MIYSGHATMRHVSRGQDVASGNEPYIGSGQIGICRFDFCLSSSPRFVADKLGLVADISFATTSRIAGISQVYKNTDDLCADLEQNFSEFKSFAEGDPDFCAVVPGRRFLSFPEFVEETELYLQSATLTLRLEDFMIDPLKEFSKIVRSYVG